MNDTLDLPPIEAPAMPVATQPAAPEPGTLKATALASFVAIRSHAAKLAEKYRAVAYDVTTPKGMAAAKDARLELREEGRFAVQRLRDRLKDEANDLKRVVTDEAEAVIKIIAPVEDAIHAQITAEEERKKAEKAEAARILAERAREQAEGVARIRAYLSSAQALPNMTAERVGVGISMLEAMSFAANEWLDPVAAANAQCETLEGLRTLQATLKAREEEAARLEAQRQQQEAERAELERQAAAMRAEQARIARLTAMIAEIRAAATGHEHATAADLYEARVAVAALDTSEAVYQELAPLANAAQMATMAVLDKFHAEACDREAAEAQRRAEVERVLSIPLPLTIPDEDPQPGALAPVAQDGAAENPVQPEPAAYPFTVGDLAAASVAGDEAAATAVDSPAPGVMAAGQAADAAPAADTPAKRVITVELDDTPPPAIPAPLPEPTLTLGDLNAWLAPLRIDSAGLESLGFPAAGRRKAAMLYHDTDKAAMVAAMVKHLQGL